MRVPSGVRAALDSVAVDRGHHRLCLLVLGGDLRGLDAGRIGPEDRNDVAALDAMQSGTQHEMGRRRSLARRTQASSAQDVHRQPGSGPRLGMRHALVPSVADRRRRARVEDHQNPGI